MLRPAILWNDQRTAAECAEIEERIGLARLIELTGNRALTGFTAPKLLWLRRHEPETYARIRHVLLPKDYVRFRLTGERMIDAADASGTLLFDVARRRWSDEVCDALELPLEWLPPAYESTEIAGAGDQAAAALGVGIVRPGPVSVVLGTSGVVFAALPAYAADAAGAGARLLPRGARDLARDGRDAERRRLGRVAARRRCRRTSPTLESEAAGWEPGAEGLLFAPYLAGERTPHADPNARGAFTGLSLRHDRGALWRATLEGVAYGLRDSLELLARARRARRGRTRLRRRRAQRALAPHRRVRARAAARAHGVGRRLGVRRRAPRRCPRGRLRRRGRGGRPLRARPRRSSSRPGTYSDGYARFRELYPTLKSLEAS